MKAVVMDKFGGPEVLRLADVPEPAAGPGEILVDIVAASVNPADGKVRQGARTGVVEARFPHVLGRDFSGVVRAIGDGVTDFAPGDAVFAVTDQGQEGAYAEAIAIKAAICAKKPDFLTHTQAAALALVGLTALTAVEDTLKLTAGETILIQGGAGGVGGFAVPLAKHLGADVIATASGRNRDYVLGLGADRVVDYTRDDFTEVAKDCDAVFDTVGGAVQTRSFKCLRPGGRLAWIATGEPDVTPPDGIEVLRPQVSRDRAHLERIVELTRSGAVRLPAIETLTLADAQRAHALSDAGHVRGKLVFQIRGG